MKNCKVLYVAGEDSHLRIPSIKLLIDVGYEVAVATPVAHPAFREAGISTFDYRLVRELNPLRDFHAVLDLRDIVKTWEPAIVHAFDTKPGFLMPIAMRNISKARVFRTITGMGRIFSTENLANGLYRILYNRLHKMAKKRVDWTIFQNPTDADYFLGNNLVDRTKSCIIQGSGIDIDALRQGKDELARNDYRTKLGIEEKYVFVMIARLVKQKGVLEYLETAKAIGNCRNDTAFLLVGPSGDDEPEGVPESLIDEYSEHVSYLGMRDDVPALLNAADAFVLPTKYREGVPRAMLEAMAMSLPVIVTDMPGCREAVMGTGAGFIVPPSDVDKLVKAVKEMLDADLKEMGESAYLAVKNEYSVDKVMTKLMSVYESS